MVMLIIIELLLRLREGIDWAEIDGESIEIRNKILVVFFGVTTKVRCDIDCERIRNKNNRKKKNKRIKRRENIVIVNFGTLEMSISCFQGQCWVEWTLTKYMMKIHHAHLKVIKKT